MLPSFLITKIVHVVSVSCSTSLVGFSKIVVPVAYSGSLLQNTSEMPNIVVFVPQAVWCLTLLSLSQDDIIDNVAEFVAAAEILKERGAYKIYIMATHGLLSADAPRLIEESAIDEVKPLLKCKMNGFITVIYTASKFFQLYKRVGGVFTINAFNLKKKLIYYYGFFFFAKQIPADLL